MTAQPARCLNCADIAARHPGDHYCRCCGFDHRKYDHITRDINRIRHSHPALAKACSRYLTDCRLAASSGVKPGELERLISELSHDIAKVSHR